MKIKTEKLYYNYSSSEPFDAEILDVRPADVGKISILLDKTIFYPEGGGQPADRGTINGFPILDVLEKDGEIIHLLDENRLNSAYGQRSDLVSLKPGPAELLLNSRRRRDLMQLHSGQHLLSGIIFLMTGVRTVSMHLGDETSTIDVDTAQLTEETLLAVEDAVADAIEENHPVIVHLCPPEDLSSFPLRRVPPVGEEVIRVVDIGRHDVIACCGTHVKSTAEIGLFRILGAEKYKGMTRISFLAGRRLLLDSRLLRQNAVIASRALSVPISETGQGVRDMAEKLARTEKRLKEFEEKAIMEKAEILIRKAVDTGSPEQRPEQRLEQRSEQRSDLPMVIESYDEENINELIRIGKIAQKKCRAVLLLVSINEIKFAAFSSIEGFDLRQFILESFNAQGGKGGGSSTFFQGSFATKEAMDAFLQAIE